MTKAIGFKKTSTSLSNLRSGEDGREIVSEEW